MWELDSIGIKESASGPLENSVLQSFNASVTFDGTRYSVALPWKDSFRHGFLDLEDNFSSAQSRLKSLSRRLSRDPVLSAEYSQVFQSLEAVGVISAVSDAPGTSGNPPFYLPHRPLIKSPLPPPGCDLCLMLRLLVLTESPPTTAWSLVPL